MVGFVFFSLQQSPIQLATMAKWDDLALELRTQIWNNLSTDARRRRNLAADNPELREDKKWYFARANYALVCRDWQGFFEKECLRSLILTYERVDWLNQMVPPHKRHLVKHIWLWVKLPHYHVHEYLYTSTKEHSQEYREARVFTGAVCGLFRSLSSWETTHGQGHGVTLELTVYSPSDKAHGLTNGCFGDRFFIPFEWTGKEYLDDPDESWVFHARRYPQFDHMYDRTLPALAKLHGLKEEAPNLPRAFRLLNRDIPYRVPVVTRFLIRRQYYRAISTDTLRQMLENLPGLERITYEMHRTHPTVSGERDQGCTLLLERLLSTSDIKRLSLYEEAGEGWGFNIERSGGLYVPLGRMLGAGTGNLEELSLSHLVDAKDFFYEFFPQKNSIDGDQPQPRPYWRNLRSLAITSKVLGWVGHGWNGGQARDNTSLDELLTAVAKALASMPKLEILEIWNAESGQENWTARTAAQGAIFRYERHSRDNGSPTLTWCSSWDTSLSSGVIEAWKDAASQLDARRDIVVENRMMKPLKTQGSILPLLKLRSLILDEVSLYQVEWEAETIERFRN
ncbi:hypothetical protein QBC37DRAFT_426296 [Rhypophila decipiens]|uniref:DUF6546 domain-containing protein n=1 Tax=Rhypophila decipiens TaxID=261697 RepID=A0AAN6Y4L3_9PEZI|nr:hypothetical protein QBC37DRAFT_426296 [Rhypophila decipiens]